MWSLSENEALEFTNNLNNNKWGISFKPKHDSQQIEFLDLLICQNDEGFETSTYFKSVDANSDLNFQSNQYRKWKENIPFVQLRRMRKNCTTDTKFEDQSKIIVNHLKEKGFPDGLVTEAYKKVKTLSQEELLSKIVENKKEEPIKKSLNDESSNCSMNFTTTFNTAHVRIRNILRKNWFILQKDPLPKGLLPKNPVVTYRRAPMIKSIVAPSRCHIRESGDEKRKTKGSFKCGSARCLCCGEIAHEKKVCFFMYWRKIKH